MAIIKTSAGILAYQRKNNEIQFLLVHPGGPFWKNKDENIWSIPKGQTHDGEDLLETAKREFEEETSFKISETFIELGSVTQKSGKVVYAWACEASLDVSKIKSNTCFVEWPPRSGTQLEIPEIDRGGYFNLETAKRKMQESQIPFLDRLLSQMQ
jgi:predicted NUDIX family NTP pyrophosphohydrolase